MSSAASKILAMAGFGLMGLLPGMAGTWLWTRHGAAEEAAKVHQQAQGEEAAKRAGAGDLRTTLLFENSIRDSEVKTATAFLASQTREQSGKNAGETERLTAEKKAAEQAEASLKELASRLPGEGQAGGALKEEARSAAKLQEATWPSLKSEAESLQTRLSNPVQKQDLPALEGAVNAFEAKLAPLPSPAEWEQKTKRLLDEWHSKAGGA